ncbi:hypothetical protein [Bradyrhizobium uaiense]|uniref:Uncharacterized protein n=1 Tax=Bradyrhizobium uaiense TaxID=2594946 RepID=A0A6P1B8T2_9BRAD|nr:hypothetical protein [Bradyrhizobium uaiense]NEU94815.1 hypothetical protein [Bradyrhizobium uaiense]
MSLLGFDAVGRRALGQLPASSYVYLPAISGAFTEGGVAALFSTSVPAIGQAFTFNGIAAPFQIGEAANVGAFAFTGIVAAFTVSEAAITGGFVLTGVPANDITMEPTLPAVFSFGSPAAPLVVAVTPAAGAYALSGISAGYTRDFINWLPSGKPSGPWATQAQPAGSKLAPDTRQFFTTDVGMLGVGARRGPQTVSMWTASAQPSNRWTVDPAQQILPPVTG